MEKILEARLRRLEYLIKNEDMYDDDFDEIETDDFEEDLDDIDLEDDESDDFDEIESDDFDESDEDVSYATNIQNPSIRKMASLLDGLAKQAKQTGNYNKLVDDQLYKTGKCLRSLDFLIKNARR